MDEDHAIYTQTGRRKIPILPLRSSQVWWRRRRGTYGANASLHKQVNEKQRSTLAYYDQQTKYHNQPSKHLYWAPPPQKKKKKNVRTTGISFDQSEGVPSKEIKKCKMSLFRLKYQRNQFFRLVLYSVDPCFLFLREGGGGGTFSP